MHLELSLCFYCAFFRGLLRVAVGAGALPRPMPANQAQRCEKRKRVMTRLPIIVGVHVEGLRSTSAGQ